jgi:SAM-dependent methyltransferase
LSREREADALARLYDLDLSEHQDDLALYMALARRTGGPIVELAAGSGRIAVPLAADGHDVVGIDLDPAMLARARQRLEASDASVAQRLTLVEGDLLDAPGIAAIANPGPYALAFIALNSILILATADQQRATLRAMAELLAPGGTAIVDAWQPTPADLVGFDGRLSFEWLRTDPETGRDVIKLLAAWYDSATRLVTLTTIFEEGEPGTAPVRWTRQEVLRLITADELAGWAVDAGLEIEQLAGDHDLAPLEAGADRVILVARKPERS